MVLTLRRCLASGSGAAPGGQLWWPVHVAALPISTTTATPFASVSWRTSSYCNSTPRDRLPIEVVLGTAASYSWRDTDKYLVWSKGIEYKCRLPSPTPSPRRRDEKSFVLRPSWPARRDACSSVSCHTK